MGCVHSKPGVRDGQYAFDAPLPMWTAPQVRAWLKAHPSLFMYSDKQLKGTTGAVFAKLTDDILKDCGITNALHRMQILHARDDLMGHLNLQSTNNAISAKLDSGTTDTLPHPPPNFLNTDREFVQGSGDTVQSGGSRNSSKRKTDSNASVLSKSPTSGGQSLTSDQSTLPPIHDYRSSLPKFERRRISGSVEIEGGRYMAMMKVLPSGALIRVVGETLPLVANPIAKQIVDLYKLQKLANYNADNCRRFIKRCCQIQSLFSSKKMKHVFNSVVIRILEEVLEEAKDFFRHFSDRGWLIRVIQLPRDRREFQRLDDLLVKCCLLGHIRMSQQSKENLKQAPRYTNDIKALSGKLCDIGGIEALRVNITTAEELQPFLVIGKTMIDEAIQMELEVYDDWIDNNGPYTVIRHPDMRTFWRRSFPRREHVPWDDFWRCFPRNLNSDQASDLSEVLSSRNHRDILQSHLTRASPDMLDVAELDFVFVPNVSIPETVRKLLRVDMVLSSLKSSGSQSFMAGFGDGPIDDGYMFNFPDEVSNFTGREELMIHMNLGMQDRGTQIVVLAGPPGVGKKAIAATMARRLISIGHWTEAYWIDLQGIVSETTAGFLIMTALGILHETPDQQYLYGFLERQNSKSIGVVISGAQKLLEKREQESAFIDYIENMIGASKSMQVILTADRPLAETRPTVLTHEVRGLKKEDATYYIRNQLKGMEVEADSLLSKITNIPLALRITCGLITSGDTTDTKLLELIDNEELPEVTTLQKCPPRLHDMEPDFLRCLTACILSLEEDLLNTLLVLSIFPSSFTEDTAVELLGEQCSRVEVKSTLRKLTNRGVVEWNPRTGRYGLPVLIRDVSRALADTLGISYEESRKTFVEYYVREVIYLSSRMQQSAWAVKAGLYIFHRDQINIEQLVSWASTDPPKETLQIYIKLLWEIMPLLKSRMDVGLLEAFCDGCKSLADAADNVSAKSQALIEKGRFMIDQSRFKDAEETLRDALELCLCHVGEETVETARCYEALGIVLHKMGKHADALDSYKKTIGILEKSHGTGHLSTANVHSLLGDVNKATRKHQEALENYEKALHIRQDHLGEDHPEVAESLATLGQHLKLMGRNNESEKIFRRSLAIKEECLGPEHPQIAETLMQMSALLRAMKKFYVAEQLVRRALSIREKCMGPNHPQTAACVQSLSALLKAMNKYTAALPLSQRNLQMRQRIYGPADVEIPTAQMTLAELLLEMGRYSEAYKHCKRSLGIRQKQLGSLHPSFAQSLNLLGVIVRAMGKADTAEQHAKESLEVRLASYHPKHPEVASSLNGLAEIEKDLGKLEEAEKHAREGLEIRMRVCKGVAHPVVALSQSTLAAILHERGQHEEAEELIRQSIETREKHFGEESPHVASALDVLATILCGKGDWNESEECAHKAVDIKRKALGQEHPEVGKSLIGLGVVLLEDGRPGVAKNKLARARDICISILGDKHPLTVQAEGLLDKCNETLATKKSSGLSSKSSHGSQKSIKM